MNMSRTRGPRYSIEYLTFIATKRKRREVSTDEVVDREEWGENSASAKRPRMGFPPTVTETMREVWKEVMTDG